MKLFDEKLEMSAIYSICNGNKKVKSRLLARVNPEYFHCDATKEAIKRILMLSASNGEIPLYPEICSDIGINEDTRKRLKKFDGPAIDERHFSRTVKNLQKFYQARKLYFLSENLNKSLLEDKVDVENLLELTANELTKARVRSEGKQELFHIGKSNNTVDVVKRVLAKTKPRLVPTGFKTFDDRNGGIAYGSLFGIGGNAGGGKTSTALQLGQNMARIGRENVAYVSLEMDEDETFERILANVSAVPLQRIKQKKTSPSEDKKIIKAYKTYVHDLKSDSTRFTIFVPEEDVNIQEVLLTLKPYGYRVIIIDYLTLLKNTGSDGSEQQWEKLGDVGRTCKVWAKANDCIIGLLAQVSEEGILRYSQALKEHANNLWTFTANSESRENKIMKIKQGKARNQSLFDFELGYDDEIYRVFDLADQSMENTAEASVKSQENNKDNDKEEYLADIGEE